MHLRWPSFKNIHKLIVQEPSCALFDENLQVIALEKIDGSNLGLEIHPEKGIIAVHGRNQMLWKENSSSKQSKEAEKSPWNIRYGAVKETLHTIVHVISKLQILAKKLILEETENQARYSTKDSSLASESQSSAPQTLIFFGEWYQDSSGQMPSWYPFGYGFHLHGTVIRTMTVDLYQDLLDHGFNPPKLMFSGGSLCDAIDALFPEMMKPEVYATNEGTTKKLEGVFITPAHRSNTFQRCCGAKWKTGWYEEQTNFIIEQKILSKVSPSMMKAVDQLRQVYETKEHLRPARVPRHSKMTKTKSSASECGNESQDTQKWHHQIQLALYSVLSKSKYNAQEIRDMILKNSDETGIAEIKRIFAETLNDLLETMRESNDEEMIDDVQTQKMMKKQVGAMVHKHIMQ